MIRDDRFVLSRRQYAIDLNSFDIVGRYPDPESAPTWHCTVKAVWFRRRAGVTVACIGKLWDFQRRKPVDVQAFLDCHDDGRYGGDCQARWDGREFWGTDGRPEIQAKHLALLKPMLDNYPEVPRGFDGWWRF